MTTRPLLILGNDGLSPRPCPSSSHVYRPCSLLLLSTPAFLSCHRPLFALVLFSLLLLGLYSLTVSVHPFVSNSPVSLYFSYFYISFSFMSLRFFIFIFFCFFLFRPFSFNFFAFYFILLFFHATVLVYSNPVSCFFPPFLLF